MVAKYIIIWSNNFKDMLLEEPLYPNFQENTPVEELCLHPLHEQLWLAYKR